MNAFADGLFDASPERPWIVCEHGNRWIEAVRCFCTEQLADSVTPVVRAADDDEVVALAGRQLRQGQPHIVVVWEITPDSFAESTRFMMALTRSLPQVVQIAACSQLATCHEATLSEFGAMLRVRQPEDLQKMARVINLRLGAS
ncbi:hypothetical protein [Novipirellula artificiosorum]|uniref:Response regulatory domain-containing protein n=1 Tax=Novipirellula artificiosorum TaxID=2528016 RepID=A0A5C6E1E1_9BACT|nr:hypothetical protein [Novipirellula artificiosorum]TWU42700.1 hypothetical protein Poly41_10000 [Novipirellula artificiosorum]